MHRKKTALQYIFCHPGCISLLHQHSCIVRLTFASFTTCFLAFFSSAVSLRLLAIGPRQFGGCVESLLLLCSLTVLGRPVLCDSCIRFPGDFLQATCPQCRLKLFLVQRQFVYMIKRCNYTFFFFSFLCKHRASPDQVLQDCTSSSY